MINLKLLNFLGVKYISLILSTSRSLLLAILLGPESFGLLASLIVIQQYLSYAALGVREGLTIRLAQEGIFAKETLRSSALLWGVCVGIALQIGIALYFYSQDSTNLEWRWVGIIALFSISNEILINIYRDEELLSKVAWNEVLYNIVPFICIMWFWQEVSVLLALKFIAFGLALSLVSYVLGVPGVKWHHIDVRAIKMMISTGIPVMVGSFFIASLANIYILISKNMNLGLEVGLVALASSVSSLVLFASNTIAWAVTSSSMRHLAIKKSYHCRANSQNVRLTYFFRLSVLASILIVLIFEPLVEHFLPAYTGIGRYILLLSLLQSSGLLLYVELNYLSVSGKTILLALGYSGILMSTLIFYIIGSFKTTNDLTLIMEFEILIIYITSVACTFYCRRNGLISTSIKSQILYLTYPIIVIFTMHLVGINGVIIVTLIYLLHTYIVSRNMLFN